MNHLAVQNVVPIVVAATLALLLLLQIKHQIVDFLWQPPYEWQNKGTFGHWGGLRHALKHALATVLVFALPPLLFGGMTDHLFATCILLGIFEFVVHYMVDWSKMNLNRMWGLTPADAAFWKLLGWDQWAHQVTYLLLVLLFTLAQ